MPSDPRRRVETLFNQALERRPGTDREAFLDGACGTDVDLRQRVEALLVANDEASGFLESPAVEPVGEGPGSRIGPYKLLQEIGEGGMGVVYMAEQERPVRRKVALKVIKLGMDTKQVIARFEAERQALAMMDHPHIARVLDAGATETGRPYFVMELVRGVPITDYCETHRLATAERLKLFVDACRAVQHAHQKGVIHRDLKPSNVLVTSHDGKPVPKIIDFGVAKATNQKLTERTLFTEFRQVIGTPEYMSPEQAEMSGLDVDTRSDIYALGVLLYQLLTGTTPVDAKRLRTAGYEEMTRMIREDEAPAPSTRISKLGQEGEEIARSQGSDPNTLSRHFRGELDWIVLKALEKDRTRRYETASAFAEDVERHLDNRPVEAGPVGAGYRLRKFVRRNRKAVAAAAAFVVVLALGFVGTTTGFLRARAEAERSNAISASLQDVLAMTDPARAGQEGEVEDLLARVRTTFGRDHATYAAVLDTLSMRLQGAGDFDTAADLCREAIEVWTRVYGPEHVNVASSRARLGSLLRLQGDEERAEQELRRALTGLEGVRGGVALSAYEACMELGDLLSSRGDYAEADRWLARAIEVQRSSATPSSTCVIAALERRVMVQVNLPDADPTATIREVYDEVRAHYPEDSPLLAMTALSMGIFLGQQGRTAEAEPYLREALRRFEELRIPGDARLLAAYDLLFQIVRGRNDPASIDEADELLEKTVALALERRFWGAEMLVGNLMHLAKRMHSRGRLDKAIEVVLQAYEVQVEAGRPVAELRDELLEGALSIVLRPGLDPELYARARVALERALDDAPDEPALIAALGAALYREGELAQALETLDLLPGPLARSNSSLARQVAPLERGFRALTLAGLGQDGDARRELEGFRTDAGAAIRLQDEARTLLAEAEALIPEPESAQAD